jgi:endonuclease/exonuclease/phosphatase family metal-dependent hydrolase
MGVARGGGGLRVQAPSARSGTRAHEGRTPVTPALTLHRTPKIYYGEPMPPLRVATLNIWNRCGPWEERLAAIRATLAKLAPDILGLQEVIVTPEGDRLDQGVAIAEGLRYHVAFGASHDEGYAFGNGVLSRWPIKRKETFLLPRLDTEERRSLLFCEIDAPAGLIPFFVTHLSWRFHEGYVRQAQVLEIAKRVTQLAPVGGFPPILVGDFNAAPDADEIRYLTGLCTLGQAKSVYLADTFGVVGQGAGVTFSKRNPFAGTLREPERRIDYIFVRGPDDRLRGEPLDARVCFDEPVDGVFPSDHFGVIASITS